MGTDIGIAIVIGVGDGIESVRSTITGPSLLVVGPSERGTKASSTARPVSGKDEKIRRSRKALSGWRGMDLTRLKWREERTEMILRRMGACRLGCERVSDKPMRFPLRCVLILSQR